MLLRAHFFHYSNDIEGIRSLMYHYTGIVLYRCISMEIIYILKKKKNIREVIYIICEDVHLFNYLYIICNLIKGQVIRAGPEGMEVYKKC